MPHVTDVELALLPGSIMLDSDIGFTKIGETEVLSTGVSGDSLHCTSAIVLFFRSCGGSSRGPRSAVS